MFCNLFHGILGEANNNKIWRTSKKFVNISRKNLNSTLCSSNSDKIISNSLDFPIILRTIVSRVSTHT